MFDRFLDSNYVEWSKEVKKRDQYHCQICRRVENLNSHHMFSYDVFLEERYNLANGITLCYYHHDLFHNIYGRGNNTKKQFREYLIILRLVERITEKNLKKDKHDTF